MRSGRLILQRHARIVLERLLATVDRCLDLQGVTFSLLFLDEYIGGPSGPPLCSSFFFLPFLTAPAYDVVVTIRGIVMAENPFVLNPSEYKRDLDTLHHYVTQAASYLNVMTGSPIEECTEYVKSSLREGGRFPFKDPDIMFNRRGDNGDKARATGTLMAYVDESKAKQEIIAPTLTTYTNPKYNKSLLVDFIEGNVAARSKAKKEMFAARVNGDKLLDILKNIEQTNKKLSNNAISGSHVSASTPLFNRTAHSTLTSNCRSTSGYGNANNEKFLSGNRHYWKPDIVRNNIISITTLTDLDLLQQAMDKFGIRYPTVEETMDCIRYSTSLYWRGEKHYIRLHELVSRLTPIKRAAFVYVGDMYHLKKYNEDVVRTFITKLSTPVRVVHPDPESVFSSTLEDYQHLANQLIPDLMKGNDVGKLRMKLKEMVKEGKDPVGTTEHTAFGYVASTTENIQNVLNEYFLMIRALWVTPNVPASVGYFPESIRRSALTSDTDSTIFTVQDWVEWHRGFMDMGDDGNATAATVVTLAAQSIVHVLARMSANFGIGEERLFKIAMKNEFKFDVFVPTQVSKHYFAIIGCQEGQLYTKHKPEIKGVHLKNSNAPKAINKAAEDLMLDIMYRVHRGEKIPLNELLKVQADRERAIYQSIKNGETDYLRRGQIKTADSYTKSPTESLYSQYLMWNEVFGPKYGEVPPPPFTVVKVSTKLDSATKTKEWLASMKDQELAERIRGWMAVNKKSSISTFYLPEQIVQAMGIPDEIYQAVDTRKIVLDTVKTFYLVFECLGVYMVGKKTDMLISDFY